MSRSQNRHDTLRWKKRRKGFTGDKCDNAKCGICSWHKLVGGNHKVCIKKKYQKKINRFRNKADKEDFYMVQINKIIPPTWELYDPSGKFMGIINEYELLDIRVQIKKAQVKGYYIKETPETLKTTNTVLGTDEDRPDTYCFDRNGNLWYFPDSIFLFSHWYSQLI